MNFPQTLDKESFAIAVSEIMKKNDVVCSSTLSFFMKQELSLSLYLAICLLLTKLGHVSCAVSVLWCDGAVTQEPKAVPL